MISAAVDLEPCPIPQGEGQGRTPVLVVGLGNVLLEDDGVGVYAIEELLRRYRLPPGVTVVDGGTSASDLLEEMADREQLIVVDAVALERPPGTLVRMVNEEVPALFRGHLSPHQLGLSDTLAALTLMGRSPHRIAVLGMVPKSLDLRIGLSPEGRAGLNGLVDLLAVELGLQAVDAPADAPGEVGFWSGRGSDP
jgi:hydrogenase maturation protease